MTAESPEVALRRGTPGDLHFLWRLQLEAMRPHVERQFGPWDETFQRSLFDTNTEPNSIDVLQIGDERIGCQWVREHDGALHLERLHVLPEWQGRGIGTGRILAFVERARTAGLPARLQVFRTNPARALYARLGFETILVAVDHETMEWTSA